MNNRDFKKLLLKLSFYIIIKIDNKAVKKGGD